MHRFFGEWYRVAGIDPKGDALLKRWKGVEAIVSRISVNETVNLAKLFLGSANSGIEFKEQFSLAFQEADPAFPMRANDLELRVLAGAAVAQCIETKRTEVEDILALAVVTGACPDIREVLLLPEIVSIAKHYLLERAVEVRAHTRIPEAEGMAATGEQMVSELKATVAQNNLAATVEALGIVLQKLHAGVSMTAKSSNEATKRLGLLVAGALEQTDILWWMFAGWSRDVGALYSTIPLPAASLVAGKELGDLTRLIPGPAAAPAVLDKLLAGAMGPSRNVSLEAAVRGADAVWKRKCLEAADPRLDELCPIHLAFRKSADGGAWIRTFESTSGVKAKKPEVTAAALATQMYHERLLQKGLYA